MSVSIAARALLNDRQADSGLVGSIYRFDPMKGAVYVSRVTVPIVDFTSNRVDRIQVLDGAGSGRYMLQLTLPDGQALTENFDIREGEDTKVVVNLPHTGPHEWSSLQALTGQFLSTDEDVVNEAGMFSLLGASENYSSLRSHPEDGFQLRFISLAKTQAVDPFFASNALPHLAELIHKDVTVDEAEEKLGRGVEVITPSQEDNDYALFEFVYEGAAGDGAKQGNYDFGPGTELARAYLLVKSVRGASLICLPTPWTANGTEYENQLLLDKRSLDGEPDYTLTIGDPMINNALGYIQNGALHEAAKLIDFDTARELLFHKISSPLSATIGGYLLVLGLDRQAYEARALDWKDWIDNLYHWFEWLPDGAILRSAMYFVLGDKDRETAYEALMTAYDRGLPYFTFGLKLMLEGMRRFANEGDVTAIKRLEILEAIAAVTDPSHNFLSISVSQRWQAEAAHQHVNMIYA